MLDYVRHTRRHVRGRPDGRGQGRRRACSPAGTSSTRSTTSAIEIWVADYVLVEYGTGAVMAVPAHDERDFAFAQTFGLPIRQVVAPRDGEHDIDDRPPTPQHTADEVMVNSGQFTGLPADEAMGRDHRLAGGARPRQAHDRLPPARLADLAPALLGRADPDRRLPVVRPGGRAGVRPAGAAAGGRRSTRRRDARRWPRPRSGGACRARPAAARRCARPTRWTRSSTPPGTSSATSTPRKDDAAWDRDDGRLVAARRPVHRRRRARDPAPAVRALLREGAVRRRPGRVPRSRSPTCSRRG